MWELQTSTEVVDMPSFRNFYRSQDAGVQVAIIAGGFTVLAAIVATLISFFTAATSKRSTASSGKAIHFTPTDMVILSVIVGVIVFAIILTVAFYWRSKVQDTQAQQEEERRQREEVERSLERLRDRMSLPGLIELNRLMLTEYHSIATIQAQKSFKSGQRAMLAGFTWLIICFTAVIVINSLNGKIVAAALAPVGSILAGFLGRTYLFVYERSLVQLNQYYNQPLLNSYYLAAERLTTEMSADAKDKMLEKVVDQLLSTAESLNEGAARNVATVAKRRRTKAPAVRFPSGQDSNGKDPASSLEPETK